MSIIVELNNGIWYNPLDTIYADKAGRGGKSPKG